MNGKILTKFKKKLNLNYLMWRINVHRKGRGQGEMTNDGLASDADLSPRDKFRVESWIPLVDALYTNSNKKTRS